jgi:hypothetical protein
VTLLVVDWRRRGRSSASPPVPVVRDVELALLAPEKFSSTLSAVSRARLAVSVALRGRCAELIFSVPENK